MRTYKILNGVCVLAGLMAMLSIGKAGDAKTGVKSDPKPYPLTKCIVTGEKLGGMGKPYVFTHEGQEIKMCCKGCLDDFNKTPAAYIQKIEAAAKQAAKDHPYPLTTCLVRGEKLGGDMKPVAFVYEDREIKLCCQMCMKEFTKNPETYMKKLAAADKTAKKI